MFERNDDEEEEGRKGCVKKKKKKSRGILVFSHLSDESRGIFVLSHACESISLPPNQISDVAVINWSEGRNFK